MGERRKGLYSIVGKDVEGRDLGFTVSLLPVTTFRVKMKMHIYARTLA